MVMRQSQGLVMRREERGRDNGQICIECESQKRWTMSDIVCVCSS